MPVHVAVGVIQDAQGRVLLTRRAASAHQGGLWEFPGGKVERGEDLARALRREIQEELGIVVNTHQPLIQITHSYPDKTVRLDVHRIQDYSGTPIGLEGQPLEWVFPEQLSQYAMPAADRPICTAIRLPQHYLITGPDPRRPDQFLLRLKTSLVRGIRLVQLRAPGLNPIEYAALAAEARALCRQYEAKLLLNCPVQLARELDADGVHLNSHHLAELSERPLTDDKWVAASCHNLSEVRKAMAINADFCQLSPVLATRSHPGTSPLGWDSFAQIVASASIPVYALGGMDRGHVREALERGGQGVAAITSLWAEEEPAGQR